MRELGRYIAIRVLVVIVLVLAWLLATRAEASNVFALDEVSGDYAQYHDGARVPELGAYRPKERLDLNVDFSFLRYGYMRNTVHSLTDQTQFRLVGWKYQIGAHIGPYADLYVEHFSQHLLDQYAPGYPVYNLIGVKLYFYRRSE